MSGVTECFTPFRANVIRATRLDACGVPVVGAKSTVVSDGVISVEGKAQVDSGNDIEVKNAKGALKISVPGRPVLKYLDITLTLTGVDPDLYSMWTGRQLVTDGQGNSVGLRVNEFVSTDFGIALETWTELGTDAGVCATDSKLWGYFLLPQIVNGMIGDVTLNDGAMDCTLTGRTLRNSGWGVGPTAYLVADSSAVAGTATPARLATSIGATDHFHMQLTPVAPPTPACGAVALSA